MQRIIVSFLTAILFLRANALTEDELRGVLAENYRHGNATLAGQRFAKDYGIPEQTGKELVIWHRVNKPGLQDKIREVLHLINAREAERREATLPAHHTPAPGAPEERAEAARRRDQHEQERDRVARERAEDARRAQEVEEARLRREHAAAALRASEDAEKTAQRTQTGHWLKDTFLIGEHRAAIAGFDGVRERLDIFNPLYGNNFEAAGVPAERRKVFPNVPIVHQYDPLASPGGAFFPLVVKLSPLFLHFLPPHVKAHFQPTHHHELYWVIQLVSSLSGTQRGPADNVIFRPQYWAHPNGAPITFHADVHLLDPEGHLIHLPSPSYSIHDGVASPNAPVIPFQDRLKSGGTVSFWSKTEYGGKTAITCHWVLNDEDMRPLGRAIERSTTVKELLENLRTAKGVFSNSRVIEEIESVFGF